MKAPLQEFCFWVFCFVPPESGVAFQKIFGFAEFLATLALLALLYTIADIRYKFRLSITPGDLYIVTFVLIAFLGLSTILTEIWLAESWWVPRTKWLTRATWQGILGLLFLATVLTWMYYAFIRPPIFNRNNFKLFANALYRAILKGDDSELAVIANELARSAESIVSLSRQSQRRHELPDEANKKNIGKITADNFAHDILFLIANRKFCRHIVQSSPVTALAFFDSMTRLKKYRIPIGQFAVRISTEAIANKDSILYQEGDEFSSGLIGRLKPWSQTVYGNYELLQTLGEYNQSPLDIYFREQWAWDAEQWNAFCKVTLVAFEGYLNCRGSPFVINRAFSDIGRASREVYKLNEAGDDWFDSDNFKKLRVSVQFIKDAIALLDKQTNPPQTTLRRQENDLNKDIYDNLASLMFEVILSASSITGPSDKAWGIHHNATWSEFFSIYDGRAWKIVRFKLRRLLYNEILEMDAFANYKGARILGYLLNVMGFKLRNRSESHRSNYRALAKVTHAWTKRNYLKIKNDLPDVADAVLIGRLSFDNEGRRLVTTYIKGLSKEAPKDYLELEDPETKASRGAAN